MFLKRRNNFIACFMSLLMCLSFLLPCVTSAKTTLTERDINVNELGMMSYEEKVEKILEPFDSYGGEVDEELLQFESTMEIVKTENNLQFLTNVQTGQVVLKEFNTILDTDKEVFYITTNYIVDDDVIYTEEIETVPYYDEETDDYFIEMPDGEIVSVKSQLLNDSLDNCLVMEAAMAGTAGATVAAGAVVLLLAATIIVCDPTINTTITNVVVKVINWVRSFFRWFRSILKKVATYVTTQVITQTLTPAISISDVKYETKELTKDIVKTLSAAAYYLCFADPTNGKMYISILQIDYNTALTIMSVPILVPCIGNDNKDMIASIFTVSEIMAYEVTAQAGIYSVVPENHGQNKGFYWHYHSIYEIVTRQGTFARPHAFFVNFCLN